MLNNRPITKDQTMRGSAFNPDFVAKVEAYSIMRQNQEHPFIKEGAQYVDYKPINALNKDDEKLMRDLDYASYPVHQKMSWDERGKYWTKVREAELKAEEDKQKAIVELAKEQEVEWEMEKLANKQLY